MKLFSGIATVIVTVFCLSIFSLNTSCSKKSDCEGSTCQNGGSCNSGKCTCLTGTHGKLCDSLYISSFVHTYMGDGTDDQTTNQYKDYKLEFYTINTVNADYVTMGITGKKFQSGSYLVHFDATVKFSNFVGGNGDFTITPLVNKFGFKISGSGSINGNIAKLNIVEADTTSVMPVSTITYTFNSMALQ